jgi:hypothetical protein
LDLEDFIILNSSTNNYHALFDRSVSWLENLDVMAWSSLLTHLVKLMKWFVMQVVKGSSTLRIMGKGDKPAPRIVFRFGKQDNETKNYLKWRRENRNVC